MAAPCLEYLMTETALPKLPETSTAALRFLALGDSYTVAEGLPASASWPQQLAQALRSDGANLAAVEMVAATGWTAADLLAAISASKPRPPFALVSLQIGVNDQYRGHDLRRYRKQFAELLLHAVALAGRDKSQVLVLSIPDWGVTPFAANDARGARRIGREIDAFNAEAKALCQKSGVRFIDITDSSRERGGDADLLAADGLHPSAAMYARWVQIIRQQTAAPHLPTALAGGH